MALANDFSFMFLHRFLLLLLLLLLVKSDSKCLKSFQCGNHFSFEFPFSDINNPACGMFTVDACDSQYPRIHLGGGEFVYTVLNKNSTNKFSVVDPEYQSILRNATTCFSLRNVVPPKSPSISLIFSPNFTFFKCAEPVDQPLTGFHMHHNDCDNSTTYYKPPPAGDPTEEESSMFPQCSAVQLPIKTDNRGEVGDIRELLTAEFVLEWIVSDDCLKCYDGGGRCLDDGTNRFYCRKQGKRASKKNFLIGGATVSGLISISIVLFICIRRKYTLLKLLGHQNANSDDENNIELFLKNNGNLAPKRYKYLEIKKMTDSFSQSLGKGGYGSVYKGKLLDGRLVAVKMLNEAKENGEEFMNELTSICRTSHVNIVALLGFCFEGSKKALIYDFMPNGSLEKFLQNTASSVLGWQKLFDIALGIARGLEYLHQGCNTRILHFDIKPHNILLDKDFNPRISDFGLARLCPNRSSVVSMLQARGTMGYIAPEVFSRNFGEVSHKSDVYSYGVMVLEIAGGDKSIDPGEVDRTSELFPQYIHKQLEMDAGSDVYGIMNGDESKIAMRKLSIVGLWCIQIDPKERPSMTKVVEMLEGKLETLLIPPKPYLFSPPISNLKFSTSEFM